jgi:hypothetical protein
MKNGKFLLNKVFKINFTKWLMRHYIVIKVWIDFIFMIYTSCFVLKAQINYIWFLKKFKVSGFLFLHVMTFGTQCISNFDTMCVHCTMEAPNWPIALTPQLTFNHYWELGMVL